MSTQADLDWTAADDRAVDLIRVLAMDSVQKAGSGHPGTAMSLAPAAKEHTEAPSFIALRTIIGWPAPNKQNTGAAHGSALGVPEVTATKEILHLDPEADRFQDALPRVWYHRGAGSRSRTRQSGPGLIPARSA